MADYISREAVLAFGYWHGKHPDFDHPIPNGVDAVDVSDIESIPAADVVEVVHGRWGDNGIPGSMLRGCSVCGFTCGSSSFFYCPSCGAKMDGREE